MATGEKEGIVHIGRESSRKRRVVVLGSGWAGFRIAKNLNKQMLDVVVVRYLVPLVLVIANMLIFFDFQPKESLSLHSPIGINHCGNTGIPRDHRTNKKSAWVDPLDLFFVSPPHPT